MKKMNDSNNYNEMSREQLDNIAIANDIDFNEEMSDEQLIGLIEGLEIEDIETTVTVPTIKIDADWTSKSFKRKVSIANSNGDILELKIDTNEKNIQEVKRFYSRTIIDTVELSKNKNFSAKDKKQLISDLNHNYYIISFQKLLDKESQTKLISVSERAYKEISNALVKLCQDFIDSL